jgi:glutaredoxin 3
MQKVIVHTAPSCPYCTRAKDLLQRKGIPFEEVKLTWNDEAAWDALEKRTGMKTVPQIFIGDKCIGGYTELAMMDMSGELTKLLA